MRIRVSVYDGSGALIGGELERKKRKSAKPLWSHAELDDLIGRLLSSAATTDEGPGHAFHGNQYVEVAGQKVVLPTKGSVKDKLHALFAQGHQFTLKELATLLGQSEITLRGRLSEIKKAAPAGGLILEKSATGHYTLKKKEAEGFTKEDDLAAAEMQALLGGDPGNLTFEPVPKKAPEPVAAPTPPPEPVAPPVAQPVPVPEPKQTLAEKTLPDVGTFSPPAGGPMSEQQADNIYNDKLSSWMSAVQDAKLGGEIEPEALDALAQGWKNTKANAMAEWKANTTGIVIPAKLQQVFKADKQLVKDVIDGDSLKTAIDKWKTNTQNEKNGSWPVDPEKAKMAAIAKAEAEKAAHLAGEEYKKAQVAKLAAEEAAKAEAYKEHGPQFATVPNYVAHDHVGLTPDDVIDESFEKGIMSVQAKLFNSGSGSQGSEGNKIEIQHALEARLTSSKAFQSLVAQRGMIGSFGGSLPAQLVASWAGSSGGANPVSNAMQIVIRDAFEMKHADVAYEALDVLKDQGGNEEMLFHKAASSLHVKYDTDAAKATFRSGLRDFALAQYHNTQDVFKAKGITHVYVARGSGGNIGVMKDAAATHGQVKLQPASSFSTNMPTAHGFSGGDSVYMVKVPTSQVLGSARSGYGCTGEYELVVLAHPKMAAIRIPADKGYSLDQAVNHVKQTIKTGPSMSEAAVAKYEATKAIKQASAELKLKVQAKVASAPPVVPKPTSYQLKGIYKAAKYGKVDEAKALLAKYKAGNYVYASTQAQFENYVGHAEKVAAHKKELLLAKAQIKAEEKAAKKAAPKKPTVHVHVHNEPVMSAGQLVSVNQAAYHMATQGHAAKLPDAWAGTSHAKLWSEFLTSGGETWVKSHPMFNEEKYKQMVNAGKTPIQIKHYLGSLKHAAAKKAGVTA